MSDRIFQLCPRAHEVLRRQLSLREQLVAKGKIKHSLVFFVEDSQPFRSDVLPYMRWREVLEALPIRYRSPYCKRHSYTRWRLALGHGLDAVARKVGFTRRRKYSQCIKEPPETIYKGFESQCPAGLRSPRAPGCPLGLSLRCHQGQVSSRVGGAGAGGEGT